MTKLSESEFISIWNNHGSATDMARATGITVRNINKRRRAIEEKNQISLEAYKIKSKQKNSYGIIQGAGLHGRERINLGILNGTVIVFSDAHY